MLVQTNLTSWLFIQILQILLQFTNFMLIGSRIGLGLGLGSGFIHNVHVMVKIRVRDKHLYDPGYFSFWTILETSVLENFHPVWTSFFRTVAPDCVLNTLSICQLVEFIKLWIYTRVKFMVGLIKVGLIFISKTQFGGIKVFA